MKPVGGLGRVSHYYGLKKIFAKMASQKASNLTLDLHAMQRTPSIEDSEYSSSAATVVARVEEEEDDATSPAMASLHLNTALGPFAPPKSNVDPAPSSTPDGNE